MSEQGTTFRLEPDDRKQIEKRRKKERDVRIYSRHQALLWLDDGKSIDEVAAAKVMDNLPDYEAQMRTLMTERFRLVPELSTLVVGGPCS